MSAPDEKTMGMAFRIVLSILGFCAMVLFYSIWDNTNKLKETTGSLDGRLIKIETKLDDELKARTKEDERRDRAIEELQRIVNSNHQKKESQ